MLQKLLIAAVLILLGLVAIVYAAGSGCFGSHEAPGDITAASRPPETVAASTAAIETAAEGVGASPAKQILFGDLHVHTTFSFDAFLISLPLIGGEGAHPPADACDFARFCSALDFWSINDHAEGISPQHWSETIDSIRQCNELAGDPDNPDTVAFLGWEWTQVGSSRDDHYGHKNVVLAGTGEDEIPARPIAAGGRATQIRENPPAVMARGIGALLAGDARIHDMMRYVGELDGLGRCDPETDTRELPNDCFEIAETPADLFRKLGEWGHDSIVIPHGTTWGFYTPTGSRWDKQLAGDMHDAKRQLLLEIYSGHGDSELFRDWNAVAYDAQGNATCPEPRADYLPTCWQAGEIIRARCLGEGASEEECEERAVVARANAAAAGGQAFLTVPGAEPDEWLDAGQCRDCREPAFNYRPGGAAQYILALGNFDTPGKPERFRLGFMSSSDNHFARPGTGYKEKFRRGMTESRQGMTSSQSASTRAFVRPQEEPVAESRAFDGATTELTGFQLMEGERQASFFLTGGLTAAHASGRDRAAIWDSLKRKEVYGTSGPRILLWFDLLNPPGSRGQRAPMGSEVELGANPIFQARAVGSFEQQPGCPSAVEEILSPERLQRLCKGECYHPSDRRRAITRIEVVRVRPQVEPGEDVAELIEDPWRRFDCQPDPAGCAVTFEDPDYARDGRDTVYYVRAFEAPAPAINAGNLRCQRNERGECLAVNRCPGPEGATDDCLAENEPRAWSSPIYVDQAG